MTDTSTRSHNSVYSTYVDLWDSGESDVEVQAALEESLTSKGCRSHDITCFIHCAVGTLS